MVSTCLLTSSVVAVLVALLLSCTRYFPTPYPDRLAVISEVDARIDNAFYSDVTWWNEREVIYTLRKMNVVRAPYFHRHLSKGGKKLSKGRYLDVGCGGGLLTEEMASTYGYNITGIDISEASLQQARQHGRDIPNLHYQVGSVYDIPFPDNSFDGVIISDVLEHLLDLQGALTEIFRVLKPGGVLVFDTISRTMKSYVLLWLISQELLQIMYQGAHDWRLFITPQEMTHLLANTGFILSSEEDWTGMDFKGVPLGILQYIAGGMVDKSVVFAGGFVEVPGDLDMIYGGVASKPHTSQ